MAALPVIIGCTAPLTIYRASSYLGRATGPSCLRQLARRAMGQWAIPVSERGQRYVI